MIEENTIADFIRKTMPKDIPHVIIDVGANATAIFSSSFIDEEWDTFLIEPQPECVKCLKMLYKTATVINAACDIKKGIKQLFLGNAGNTELATLSTSKDPWFDKVRSKDYIDVPCDTLTHLLDEHNCPTDIGILKIDCESWDPIVIESLDLKKYTPLFIITEEYYWEPQNIKKKYDKLEDNGYILLGFEGYNSIWRKKSKFIRYTTLLLRDFYKTHNLYHPSAGELPLKGNWS